MVMSEGRMSGWGVEFASLHRLDEGAALLLTAAF